MYTCEQPAILGLVCITHHMVAKDPTDIDQHIVAKRGNDMAAVHPRTTVPPSGFKTAHNRDECGERVPPSREHIGECVGVMTA